MRTVDVFVERPVELAQRLKKGRRVARRRRSLSDSVVFRNNYCGNSRCAIIPDRGCFGLS
jgi:hypothetical protein